MNTVRQMLFLPTTREEKYKAKQVIDSFVVRLGNVHVVPPRLTTLLLKAVENIDGFLKLRHVHHSEQTVRRIDSNLVHAESTIASPTSPEACLKRRSQFSLFPTCSKLPKGAVFSRRPL
jgi:hypothetical protein